MNLVAGYDSSSSDDDEPKQQKQQQQQTPPAVAETAKGKGKAVMPAPTSTTQPKAGDASKNKRKSSSKKKKTSSKKRKKTKTVNALVLSPEIQAALARGDTLGDSDTDDDGPTKKPPKIVRPPGSNPNDLLSLLPQPSTAASADDILLKNQKRREDAKTAKEAAKGETPATAASSAVATPTTTPAPAPAPATGVGKVVEDQDSDSDDGEDDLLAGMHAKAAAGAAAGSDSGSGAVSAPLFTLPSRAKPPPGPVATGSLLAEEGVEAAGTAQPLRDGTAAGAPGSFEHHVAEQQQWGAVDIPQQGAFPQGGFGGAGYSGGAGAGASAQYAAYGNAPGQHHQQQQQQAPYYHPDAAQPAAGFGGAAQQGASHHEPEFGGGGKATRRKGRDMERALARGDLGALGSELPVMDLHQGSNEYTPLRSKPITAAMKQEQKHIESSVYDPRTGKTVKTLEPTSTQKRKHQINQLAVQAASMERDLMERSGASRLTKAQTHAKYGW